MQAPRITIAMTDHSAGFEATPDRVRLGDLVAFSADVTAFLRGEDKEVDTNNLEVAVRKGSLAIETAPLLVAPNLFRDLRTLLGGELLDSLDAKRREVMERWQKASRQSKQVSYRITAPFLGESIHINAETDYHADDADQWVQVERYVRGEIQDLGGITKANAHIKLPDGRTLKVTTEREVLRNDTVNRLYKLAMLRIKAEYNVLTRELRNARLVEFVEHASTVDEESLSRLTRRGAAAWKDVPNATAWVDELRGNKP
ncbi:hypothetical protein [Limnohabitans sp.]|jgi:hypothetical protein|uniref:hypothetical protein n=1 Tax=Limnohabitans sp. TaxID=1907725 RepID=UPI0037C0838D